MRRLLLIPLLLPLFACADHPMAPAPNASGPRFDIADAARDYKQGFYWLPPIVNQPEASGVFDAAVSPTVEICELVDGACGTVLATYTLTTGPGGEVIRLQDEHYHVNWHTDEFTLTTTSSYRISVRAGIDDVLLGYADVQPATNGSGFKNLDSNQLMGLVDGRTLPIKFRIETGIVGRVVVQPAEATAAPGATQQFVAILTDLHGNPVSADVEWSSSDESVATVGQSGLATAVGDGVAIITATADRISGSATLTVEGGIVLVSAGDAHSCALNEEGAAFCWGLGSNGQLGNGFLITRLTPTLVVGGHTFSAITTAETHSCAVTTAGQAYCWGLNNVGQLGNGSMTSSPLPSLVSGDLTFSAIAAGTFHTCGLTTGGQIYCWGFGAALGSGPPAVKTTPTLVSADVTFASLAAGRMHTCGLTTDGALYCWGTNTAGQLGNGTTATALTPTPVTGTLTFASIGAGDAHTCAIASAGEAYCWGDNAQGRLGVGTIIPNYTVPQLVSGGLAFNTITAGEAHSCAIATDNAAYCWGSNGGGRLGVGTTTVPQSLVPAAVTGGLSFRSIDAGDHTCGVTTTNAVYCWGPGGSGRLGNGSTADQLAPTAVGPMS